MRPGCPAALADVLYPQPHARPRLGVEGALSWAASWAQQRPLLVVMILGGGGMPTSFCSCNSASASSPLSGWPPNGSAVFSGFPYRAWGTLSSRGRAVGSWAKLFLELNSRCSWSGAWHRNPTCFVSGISWRASHMAVCVRPEPRTEGSSRVLPSRSLTPPAPFALVMAVSEQA